MRLIRLLTASKSWMIVKSEPNRFRDVRENLIPNLQCGPLESHATVKPSCAFFDSARQRDSGLADSKDNGLSVPDAARVSFPPGKSARHDAFGEPALSYAAKLWARLLHPFSSVASPSGGKPSRGGARLDNVRVVRNDLTESDFEFVGASRPGLRERAATKSDLQAGAVRKVASLSRFAGQLFEVGRSRH